jgi:hypothetical protein
MNYPDGSVVRVGDLIWWNEGNCVGFVQVVAEYKSWGLNSPHMFVSNRHPFDRAMRTGVAHDKACFEDEGIGLLNKEERSEFERAVQRAKNQLTAGMPYSSYSVQTKVQNCKRVGWIIIFRQQDEEVMKVQIPS